MTAPRFSHPAYQRLYDHWSQMDGAGQEGIADRQDVEAATQPQRATAGDPAVEFLPPGVVLVEPTRPSPQLPRRPAPPSRPEVCPRCHAFAWACYCRADVADLRYFARQLAELHQPTGTGTCGCGAHACPYRARLDRIHR